MSIAKTMTSLADAVREKTGKSGAMTLAEMTAAVQDMELGETVPEVAQATPVISVDVDGVITATATQEAGRVEAGTAKATYAQTKLAAKTYTPGTSNQYIYAGRYVSGTQIIQGDANLKAENIVSGVSIFGIDGTAQTGTSSGGTVETCEVQLNLFYYDYTAFFTEVVNGELCVGVRKNYTEETLTLPVNSMVVVDAPNYNGWSTDGAVNREDESCDYSALLFWITGDGIIEIS